MTSSETSAFHRLGAAHARSRARGHRRAGDRDVQFARQRIRRRRRENPQRPRPRDRHRHGQIRPYRPQDRRHAGLDRNAGLLRARRRGQPRRPRHDHVGRRHAGAVMVGRDRGTQGSDQLFAALPHRADRDDGQRRKHARQGRRHRAGAAGGARSLPAQPRADHLIADAACARRCARRSRCWRAAASPRSISASFIRAASSAPR